MALRYRVPLPGPFYYSGRIGSKRRFPRSSNAGTGPMGFIVKWLAVYPSIVFFGVGLAIMVAPFYGVFWVVRRSLRNCQRCQPVARRFPVQRPVPRSYGFVPVRRQVQPAPYGFVPAQRERPTVGGGPFGSDRIGACELGCPFLGLAPCPPSRDCMGRGMRPRVAHRPSHTVFRGVRGDGPTTSSAHHPGMWRTSHPGGADR